MPRFQYKIRDQQSRVITGIIDGVSVDEVLDRLGERDLTPIALDELNFDGTKKNRTLEEKFRESWNKVKTRVPFKEVVFFTRQFATMVNAGVPISAALEQLAAAEKAGFKKILQQVANDISMGSGFSDAIARHPGAFDNVYVSVARSGEVSGALDTVMDELASYMENVQAMRSKVKGAMRYPVFIGMFVTSLILAIIWKLVPIFERLYGSFNAKLPPATQLMISISQAVRENALTVLGLALLAFAVIAAVLSNDGVKRFAHQYMLYFPVFGRIIRQNVLARFSRTMALLLESGTPILQAVEISAAIVGNKYYAQGLEQTYKLLRTGELLSAALKETGRFPPLVLQLVSTGESTGSIGPLLRKAAEFYEREVRVTVDSLAAIIEPFLIMVLGGFVGVILIALYLPVFTLGKMMK